jgi:predicted N-formylglutamate amidohydrolase
MSDNLLSADEPAAVEHCHARGKAPVVLTCDHASHRIPAALGMLGLTEVVIQQHIGWDIGAAAVTRALAERLSAPALLSGYSRLVIDCNRDPGDPTSIPPVSDHVMVPGNRGLSEADRRARAEACLWPYQQAITARLDRVAALGVTPVILSIHSFTPRMNGFDRPWQIGILWDRDPRLALPLIAGLAGLQGLVIGDNEPYSARDPEGFTLQHHAVPRGLPHVLIELRQDEIDTEAGAQLYAERLDRVLKPILADPELYRPGFYR